MELPFFDNTLQNRFQNSAAEKCWLTRPENFAKKFAKNLRPKSSFSPASKEAVVEEKDASQKCWLTHPENFAKAFA